MRIRYNTYNNKNHLFYKNRQINDNLEQQAQALFKSWFVDFEPFKDGEFVNSEFGMIPKGWRTGVLSDIIEILSGFAFKSNTFEFEGKYKLVTIKAVQDGYLELNGADGINDVPVKVPRHCFLKKKDIRINRNMTAKELKIGTPVALQKKYVF